MAMKLPIAATLPLVAMGIMTVGQGGEMMDFEDFLDRKRSALRSEEPRFFLPRSSSGFGFNSEATWESLAALHFPEVVKDTSPPFVDLHVFFVRDPFRVDQYCFCLRHNADRHAIRSIHLITSMRQPTLDGVLSDECKLTPKQRRKVWATTGVPDHRMTYKMILQSASAQTSQQRLQMVSNGDIAIATDLERLRPHLQQFYWGRTSLHLSWNKEVGSNLNRCTSNIGSYDAVLFNTPIDVKTLNMLDIPMYRESAENMVICRMFEDGFRTMNPCDDLTTVHIHPQATVHHRPPENRRMDNFRCTFFAKKGGLAALP